MRRKIWAAPLVAVLAMNAPAAAQERFGFEIRGGAAFPNEDGSADALDTGFGFDATLRYRFLPHLAAYAGWGWLHLSADYGVPLGPVDLEETGYVYGLRFEHPFSEASPIAWWIRAGGTFTHVEIEDDDGDLVTDSGHGAGWEASGGLAFALNDRWSVTPGIRYRSAEAELEYVAVEIGFATVF